MQICSTALRTIPVGTLYIFNTCELTTGRKAHVKMLLYVLKLQSFWSLAVQVQGLWDQENFHNKHLHVLAEPNNWDELSSWSDINFATLWTP